MRQPDLLTLVSGQHPTIGLMVRLRRHEAGSRLKFREEVTFLMSKRSDKTKGSHFSILIYLTRNSPVGFFLIPVIVMSFCNLRACLRSISVLCNFSKFFPWKDVSWWFSPAWSVWTEILKHFSNWTFKSFFYSTNIILKIPLFFQVSNIIFKIYSKKKVENQM